MISPLATVAKQLIAAGVTRDQLVIALAEVEESMLAYGQPGIAAETPNSYSPVRRRSAHAEAQARYRQKQKAKLPGITGDHGDAEVITGDGKASPVITSDVTGDHLARAHTQSSLPSLIENTEKTVCESPPSARSEPSPAPSRVITFEALKAAYPWDNGMSEPKARMAWNALSEDDRILAVKACPFFAAVARKRGPNYSMLHLHTFLLDRRFANFAADIAQAKDHPPQIFILAGTEKSKAWEKYRGKAAPINRDGGWFYPSEWPPDDERQQMNMRLLRQVS